MKIKIPLKRKKRDQNKKTLVILNKKHCQNMLLNAYA